MADDARVYGMADGTDAEVPAEQGVRGEQSGVDAQGYAHDATLSDGRTVTVVESSGVAFAEATGRAGRRAPQPYGAAHTDRARSSRALGPGTIAIAMAAVALGYRLGRRTIRR